MIIYRYDEITKEYIGEGTAELDVLETQYTGIEKYLIPSNATDKKPNIPQGYCAVFGKDDWEYVVDNRGVAVINTTTKEIEEVNYIGKIKDGYMKYDDYLNTQEYKDDELRTAKANKHYENESKRNVEFINTPIGRLKTETPLGDLKSAIVLFDKIAKVNNGLPAGAVRIYDEFGNVGLSPAISLPEYELLVSKVALEYIKIDRYSTYISNKINNSDTVEEVNSVVIDYNNIPEV